MDDINSARTLLSQVNGAIQDILVSGQSYQIGTRKMTRADLKHLREMRAELTAQISTQEDTGFMPDTRVARFEGR